MPLSLIFLIWVIVVQTFAQAMQKLFKSTKFGVFLKNRSAIYMALTACLQSSVINGFLIRGFKYAIISNAVLSFCKVLNRLRLVLQIPS